MSNQYPAPTDQPQYLPYQPPAPSKPSKFKRFALPIGLLLLGLIIGGASGAGAVPEPVQIVKEVPVEKIVEKKVTVTQTPASCLKALDLNEEAFSGLAESMGHLTDGDYAAAGMSSDRVKALVPKVNAAKAECRASQ